MNENEKLAWRVEVNGLGCIVFATTKAKAKWIAVKSYREAGFGRKGEWPSCSAGREPGYDKSRLRFEKRQAFSCEVREFPPSGTVARVAGLPPPTDLKGKYEN